MAGICEINVTRPDVNPENINRLQAIESGNQVLSTFAHHVLEGICIRLVSRRRAIAILMETWPGDPFLVPFSFTLPFPS